MSSNPNFERLLVDTEVLTQDTLAAARAEAKKQRVSLFRYLIEKGILSDEGLAKSLATFHHVEYMAGPLSIDPKLAKQFPSATLRRHGIVPLRRENQKITVVTADPSNFGATDEIGRLSGLSVEVICSTESVITDAINNLEGTPGQKVQQQNESDVAATADQLLLRAAKSRASDIHFEPQKTCGVIRERVDGVLYEEEKMAVDVFRPLISRLKIIAGMDIVEKRLAQDGRFRHKVGDIEVEIRASTLPTIYGEKMVLRILRSGQVKPSIEMLRIDRNRLTLIKEICKLMDGLVVVAGPTGSGKSTSIYSILGALDRQTRNLVTIEDPVEYELDKTSQVQINPKIGLTFASVLPYILRQDPDIIMIGEMRDEKTAQLGMRAAITGHLVFSTIHAPDALQTVVRLVDMGVPLHMINAALKACISQRLLRRLCQKCKVSYEASNVEKKVLGDPENKKLTLYKPGECKSCHHLGYNGRSVVMEILPFSERLQEAIAKGDRTGLKKIAADEGFKTMREHAIERVKDGDVSLKELLAHFP